MSKRPSAYDIVGLFILAFAYQTLISDVWKNVAYLASGISWVVQHNVVTFINWPAQTGDSLHVQFYQSYCNRKLGIFPAEAGTHLPTPEGWKAELTLIKNCRNYQRYPYQSIQT